MGEDPSRSGEPRALPLSPPPEEMEWDEGLGSIGVTNIGVDPNPDPPAVEAAATLEILFFPALISIGLAPNADVEEGWS